MEAKPLIKKLKYFTPSKENENIGSTQRVLSVIGGTYMIWSAISSVLSKKKTGVIAPVWNAVSGGYLIYRGLSGHCAIKEALKSPEQKLTSFLHKN